MVLRAEDITRRPPHFGTEDLKCLDEHASLDGHMQRSVDVQTTERQDRPKLLTTRHGSPHLVHCGGEFLMPALHDLKNDKKRLIDVVSWTTERC